MIRLFSIATLLVASTTALADDSFDRRKENAARIEATQEGRDYLMRFMPEVHKDMRQIMSECFPSGPIGTIEKFTVVADVLPDGSVANVEVQPVYDRTLCYATKFGRLRAPEPSGQFSARGLPIVIKASQEYTGTL